MTHHPIPDDIVALAQERSLARSQGAWAVADELKARIESAGWRVVDDGTAFDLIPRQRPDVVVDGETRYGSAASVPSRRDEAETAAATVAVTANGSAGAFGMTLDGVRATVPADAQVLLVADPDTPIDADGHETIRGVKPFTAGEALSIVLRRATGAIIVILEAGHIPTGDVVGPLIEALGDPSVAVAGFGGLRSSDLHRFEPGGVGEVTAFGAGCYAFRRSDALTVSAEASRLRVASSVATWWSLVLRGGGPHDPPRRALSIALPLGTSGLDAPASAPGRLARRDRYRITELIGERRWLAAEAEEVAGVPGERPQDDHQDDHGNQPDHASGT